MKRQVPNFILQLCRVFKKNEHILEISLVVYPKMHFSLVMATADPLRVYLSCLLISWAYHAIAAFRHKVKSMQFSKPDGLHITTLSHS